MFWLVNTVVHLEPPVVKDEFMALRLAFKFTVQVFTSQITDGCLLPQLHYLQFRWLLLPGRVVLLLLAYPRIGRADAWSASLLVGRKNLD